MCRDFSFDNPDVMAIDTSFSCRYMARGASWLWDLSHLYPYPGGRKAIDMIKYETTVYCNVLVRFFHLDFHNLLKGSDTLAI